MGAVKLFCAAAMKGAPPLDGPVAISVNAVYAWPASWSAKRRAQPNARWKISRPDLDNCSFKLLADALNTVAWTDDARICVAILRKYYGDFPQLEVSIRGL
jgi:Holliday junction resolvase RusA-like endonuclease